MWLSVHAPTQQGEIVWWESEDPAFGRPPIVGIEAGSSVSRTDQVVICDRGLRIFRYEEGELIATGPPVPPRDGDPDIVVIRGMLRHCGANPNRAGPPPLPHKAIDKVESVHDVADLLQQHWAGVRVAPPAGLEYGTIEDELERSRHGISELQAAADAF